MNFALVIVLVLFIMSAMGVGQSMSRLHNGENRLLHLLLYGALTGLFGYWAYSMYCEDKRESVASESRVESDKRLSNDAMLEEAQSRGNSNYGDLPTSPRNNRYEQVSDDMDDASAPPMTQNFNTESEFEFTPEGTRSSFGTGRV